MSAATVVLLVPERISVMVGPSSRAFVLGVVVSVSGVFSGLTYPIIGHVSDGHSSRWGRRTPFMFWGTLAMTLVCAPLALSGQMQYLIFFSFCVVLLNTCMAVVSSPYTALIPDLVAPHQYGAASGYMGLMSMLGNAIGAGVIGLLAAPLQNTFGSYYTPTCIFLAAVQIASFAATFFSVREKPFFQPHAADTAEVQQVQDPTVSPARRFFFKVLSIFQAIISASVAPFRSRDFFWVFWTRFLMVAGLVSVQNFLQFWIEDVIPQPYTLFNLFTLPDAKAATSIFLLPLLLGAMLASLVAGILSDHVGRKVMVYIAGSLQAITAVAMIFFPLMNAIIGLGFFFGLGYGAFASVDFALAAESLPNAKETAKDFGVWHLASNMASMVAPAVAGMMLDFFKQVGLDNFGSPRLGYTVLLSFATVLFVLSTVLVSLVSVGGKPVKKKPTEVVAAAVEEKGEIPLENVSSVDREDNVVLETRDEEAVPLADV